MAHLYYAEGVTSDSPGLFTDLKSDWYWSGTASEVYQNVWYVFYPPAGYQDANSDQSINYAMPVFSGTLVTDAVPEPSTYFLLGIGLGVVGFARKKMKSNG